MDSRNYVDLTVQLARRLPPPKDAPPDVEHIHTYIFRVRARDIPAGIPDDANPRQPNLNRHIYRKVQRSLRGEEGEGTFHLKHGGIVLIADKVQPIDENAGRYRLWFSDKPEVKQGIVNGNHSYRLLLNAQKPKSESIPANQYVEIKVYTDAPAHLVADIADGLNSSLQVREESLANLRDKFVWLQEALAQHPGGEDAVAWNEGPDTDTKYDVREIIALLMALDTKEYPLDNPVGIENTYARLSTVFRRYIRATEENPPARVERFASIATQALHLYEYIRYSAKDIWPGVSLTDGRGIFVKTILADTKGAPHIFPFLLDENGKPRTSDVRLIKPATVACFAAFRAFVKVPDDGPADWRYPFAEIIQMWHRHGPELLREAHDAVRQFNGAAHYAGRSPALYRATTKTLELAYLRRQVAV
jgi:hypothetical protein